MLEWIRGWRVTHHLLRGAGGPAWGQRVPSDSSHSLLLLRSLELCCKACVAFYHWVMVVVTGGVGVAATLPLCGLLVWPIRLRKWDPGA